MAREGIFSDDLVSKHLHEKMILAACKTNSCGFLKCVNALRVTPQSAFGGFSDDPPSLMWITPERANLIDKRVICI